jgi:hypothetical protein
VRMGGCERDRRPEAPASEEADDSTDAAAANSMASGAFLLALVSSARAVAPPIQSRLMRVDTRDDLPDEGERMLTRRRRSWAPGMSRGTSVAMTSDEKARTYPGVRRLATAEAKRDEEERRAKER